MKSNRIKQILLTLIIISSDAIYASSIYLYNGLYGRKVNAIIQFRNAPEKTKKMVSIPNMEYIKIGTSDDPNVLKLLQIDAKASPSQFIYKSKELVFKDIVKGQILEQALSFMQKKEPVYFNLQEMPGQEDIFGVNVSNRPLYEGRGGQ